MFEVAVLVENVFPRSFPARKWQLSPRKRLHHFVHRDAELAGQVLRVFLRAIAPILPKGHYGHLVRRPLPQVSFVPGSEIRFATARGRPLCASKTNETTSVSSLFTASGFDTREYVLSGPRARRSPGHP
jgi:hypothetical protein